VDSINSCPVCGVYVVDGTFRFSYQPKKIISADDVAGLVCSNLTKIPSRTHLVEQCINKHGNPELGDNWDKRLNTIDK
jgi:hypothetical protein